MLDPHPDPWVERRLQLLQRYMRWLESDGGILPPMLEHLGIKADIPFTDWISLQDNLVAAISMFIQKTRQEPCDPACYTVHFCGKSKET